MSLEAEVETARRRVERLTELLRVEATSAAELERASAAPRRTRGASGIRPPGRWSRDGHGGQRPGCPCSRTVGRPRSPRSSYLRVRRWPPAHRWRRLVKVRPLWVVLALRPTDADRVTEASGGPPAPSAPDQRTPLEIPARDASARLPLTRARPQHGQRRTSIVEVDRRHSRLPIGSAVDAELLLRGERRGIVVPASALVDDCGRHRRLRAARGRELRAAEVRVLVRQGREGPRRGLGSRGAARHARGGRRPAERAALHRRSGRPRALRSDMLDQIIRTLAASSAGPSSSRPRRCWSSAARCRARHAGRRLPRPHRAHRHGHHRGARAWRPRRSSCSSRSPSSRR